MKTIKIIRFGVSEDIKQSIRNIIDDLERYNYAVSCNGNAVRMFSRFMPDNYKTGKIIRFYRAIDGGESLIRLDSNYEIKKFPSYNFLIKNKESKDKSEIENIDI